MVNNEALLNKDCSLRFENSNFVLHGVVVGMNNAGIFFKTPQKTSFIAWSEIGQLQEE
jgi:hypothetical protein